VIKYFKKVYVRKETSFGKEEKRDLISQHLTKLILRLMMFL